MKNDFEIRGDIVVIFLHRKDGTVHETLIDLSNFQKVNKFPFAWYAHATGSARKLYVSGNIPLSRGRQRIINLHNFIITTPRGLVIDHINGDTLDNRNSNLRIVTVGQNNQNVTKRANNTSGYKGVVRDKHRGKWVAKLKFHGKTIYLGGFDDVHEAGRVAAEARARLLLYSPEAREKAFATIRG